MPFLNQEDILLYPLPRKDLDAYSWMTEKEKNKKWYRLFSSLRFKNDDGSITSIPAGFVTEGASIPRGLWSLVGSPFTGNYIEGAIIHDYRYWLALTAKRPIGTRKEADDIFLKTMIFYGTPEREAKLKYWAVRLFGPRWGRVEN